MVPFSEMLQGMESLSYRNKRLQLRRVSLRADLLVQRSKTSGVNLAQILQADFVLYLRGCFEMLLNKTDQPWLSRIWWWPETLLYSERHGGRLEIFARGESREYFNRIKCLFDIKGKEDFLPLFTAYKEQQLHIPKFEWHSISPIELLGYEQLATRP